MRFNGNRLSANTMLDSQATTAPTVRRNTNEWLAHALSSVPTTTSCSGQSRVHANRKMKKEKINFNAMCQWDSCLLCVDWFEIETNRTTKNETKENDDSGKLVFMHIKCDDDRALPISRHHHPCRASPCPIIVIIWRGQLPEWASSTSLTLIDWALGNVGPINFTHDPSGTNTDSW